MNTAMSEFIKDPQDYADSGFENSWHLAKNLMTIFGWEEVTAQLLAEALLHRGYGDEHGKALASIAESLVKIAISLENEDTRDSLAESASIWGIEKSV